MARNAIYSLNLCLRSDTSSQKLIIILTLLLGFDIVTTCASETGVLFQKKRKAAPLAACNNSSHKPMLRC